MFQLTLPEAVKQILLALQTGYAPAKPATCFGRASCHSGPGIPDCSRAAWVSQEGAAAQQGPRHQLQIIWVLTAISALQLNLKGEIKPTVFEELTTAPPSFENSACHLSHSQSSTKIV